MYEILECLIGLMGSSSNSIVLLAIYKERKLRTITNCFVGSLAASDVLVGLIVPPITILTEVGLPRNFTGCVVLNSLVVLLTNVSVLNLLSVALERFLAIRNPFLYHRWLTNERAMVLVAVSWVGAMFIGLLPLLGWNAGGKDFVRCTFNGIISLEYMVYFVFFVCTIPPLIVMCLIYFYIFTVVRKTKQAILKLMISQGKNKINNSLKTNSRGDLGILLVIALFVLCWMPFHIVNCFRLFGHYRIPNEVYKLCSALSHLNSAVNPFLFAFGYTQFKLTIKQILFGRCISPDQEDGESAATGAKAKHRADSSHKVHTIYLLGCSISLTSETSQSLAQIEDIAVEIIHHPFKDNSQSLSKVVVSASPALQDEVPSPTTESLSQTVDPIPIVQHRESYLTPKKTIHTVFFDSSSQIVPSQSETQLSDIFLRDNKKMNDETPGSPPRPRRAGSLPLPTVVTDNASHSI